jgi:hypothetical protein
MLISQDGHKQGTSATFFRGEDMQFHPTDESLERPDCVAEYLIKGWMPKQPMIESTTPLVAFGSCFAENISLYLHKRGYNVLTKKDNQAYVTRMGDGIVNTFAILQQFQWAWLGKVPASDLWHGYSAESFGYDEEVRADTKRLFDEAEVFVITLGLSEIWYDEPTGEVFWRAVPADKYDARRHKFRVSTVAENKANLEAIHQLIRQHRPRATIVITVSPIPLRATFRPATCISANAVSKAVLRAAVDEFMREAGSSDQRLHYFPSYDVVMHAFNNQWLPDRRHVYPHVLEFNMKIFEAYYCKGQATRAGIEAAYTTARRRDVLLARQGHPTRSPEQQAAFEARRQAKIAARVAARVAAREAAKAAVKR